MSAHLQEMQVKFQERFDRLEEELRSKNHLIEQLKDHICKLENMDEVSLSVSIVLCMFIQKKHKIMKQKHTIFIKNVTISFTYGY